MWLFQMNHLAGLSCGLFRFVQPGNPPHHIFSGLEQISELLAAVLTSPAQLLERAEDEIGAGLKKITPIVDAARGKDAMP